MYLNSNIPLTSVYKCEFCFCFVFVCCLKKHTYCLSDYCCCRIMFATLHSTLWYCWFNCSSPLLSLSATVCVIFFPCPRLFPSLLCNKVLHDYRKVVTTVRLCSYSFTRIPLSATKYSNLLSFWHVLLPFLVYVSHLFLGRHSNSGLNQVFVTVSQQIMYVYVFQRTFVLLFLYLWEL